MKYLDEMEFDFEQVVTFGEKKGNCIICGKPCQRTKAFSGRVSPHNLDENNKMKSRDRVWDDLMREKEEWLYERLMHKKCETKLSIVKNK